MSETIDQTITRLRAFIQSQAPNVDLSPGSVFSELVLNLESQVQNQVYNDIDAISSLQAIKTALVSLTDTYSPVIDAIASNYNVYRNQGTASTGVVKVYLSSAANVTVPANTVFTQPTLGYTYTNLTAVKAAAVANPGTTPPTQALVAENNLFYFTVPVVAQTIGQATAINNATQFIISNASQILSFNSAVALGPFSAGLNTETDKQLIARFRNGLGVNNLLSQNSITNKLESIYPNFQDVYLADSTSPVNTRSYSNPLGYRIPGCVDVWVKDGVTIPYVSFTVTSAAYIASNTWQVPISNTVAPGFYRIISVQDANTPTNYFPYSVMSYSNAASPNLLNTVQDARFSIYQQATMHVTADPTASGNFLVTVMAVPDLASMQALFLDDGNRIPCADYLVKGIVPCMVSMSLSLVRNNPGDVIDITALQNDIFNYVNGLGSGESLAVSKIVNICHNYNIARVDLPVIVNGTILSPTYTINNETNALIDNNVVITGIDFLQIPTLPDLGVIPQNTMFYISYFDSHGNTNININVS